MSGEQFGKGPGVYKCRFSARGITTESLAELVEPGPGGGDMLLKCTVPVWPSYEAVARFTIVYNDAQLPKNMRAGIAAGTLFFFITLDPRVECYDNV